MAVYERSYQAFTGPWTERRTRFLIIPKYAYQDIFQSKGFITFLVVCFIWPAERAAVPAATHDGISRV